MVKVIKSIIARKPEDLVKLKYKTGIIFGRNIRKVERKIGSKMTKAQDSLTTGEELELNILMNKYKNDD